MFKHTCILSLFVLLLACRRDEISEPAFTVTTARAEYKAGDTVVFRFSGEPDIITFYSGEAGKEYRYRNRTDIEGGVTEMEFSSRVLYGSQVNNMRVVASTNFSGIYDSANIKKGTWADISSRFKLATAANGALSTVTPSGKADISDLVVKGKPLYIAYQYVGEKPPGTSPTQRTWRVQSFSMTNTLPGMPAASLVTLTNASWISVDLINTANKWTVAADMLQFAPNGTLEASEDWIITKPVFVTKVAPDKGTPIKEFSQRKNEFNYVFPTAGTYTVTLVASNTSAKEQLTVVKELTLKILP